MFSLSEKELYLQVTHILQVNKVPLKGRHGSPALPGTGGHISWEEGYIMGSYRQDQTILFNPTFSKTKLFSDKCTLKHTPNWCMQWVIFFLHWKCISFPKIT
jgi:hypothetical protein